jgi:hypothetical protein
MLLGEIAEPYPVVGVNTSAFVAAQLLAKDRLPGLVVVEADGSPKAVLPACGSWSRNTFRTSHPWPVLGERAADRIAERLRQATVASSCRSVR